MFSGQSAKYELFRAKFKIWIPSLQTLDGTDFKKDTAIEQYRAQIEQEKRTAMNKVQGLSTIPEEGGAGGAAAGGQSAAAAGNNAQRSYQFNQRAYKKYHSSKSLVERILKSHSEGNRFIRNEDL